MNSRAWFIAGAAATASIGGVMGSAMGSTTTCEQSREAKIKQLERKVQKLKQTAALAVTAKGVSPTVQETETALRRSKKTIAIFGGTFDPITNAHLANACEILHNRKADEVWLVPSGDDTKPGMTPGIHRLIMCHTAVNGSFGTAFPIKVKDFEVTEKRDIPTYDLIKELQDTHPHLNFVFVVGSDLLQQNIIRQWDRGQELWENIAFLGLRRPGFVGGEMELPPSFRWISEMNNSVVADADGGDVRARMMAGGRFGDYERAAITERDFTRIEGLMPAGVVAHIIRNELYHETGVE
jgi:nicotinate-nucleotide adenylyltransferase